MIDLGDKVGFGSNNSYLIGTVEEIRKGFQKDHLLVVNVGDPWEFGDKFVVLTSYAEPVVNEILN